MSATTIEWTSYTWNPTRGCIQISPGCANCYAKTYAERFRGVKGNAYEQGFDPRMAPQMLLDPLKLNERRSIFVNSMSDLFHDEFPNDYIAKVARVMEVANWHTYQVLTKRSQRMRSLLSGALKPFARLPHIWWGVSVENKKHGLPRIDDLQKTPAASRFLSIEPLIEDLGKLNLKGIHWVIVGGESGPGFRPMREEWALPIREQCREAGVPFFFKQWGGTRKKEAGRLLDGETYDEIPVGSTHSIPSKDERTHLMADLRSEFDDDVE